MLVTIVLSLFAGIISVLAPCVLPFLPVIVGGSIGSRSRLRPYLIALGLVISLLAFTLLLKVSSVAIGIDPRVWQLAAGVLVVLLGIFMLFPDLWSQIALRLRLNSGSHKLLQRAQNSGDGPVSALLTGAALGPVFSSCSPVYAWVIATILPVQPLQGFIYISAYCVGMAGALLVLSLAGRKLISKLGWAVNPRGWFQRIIAVLFILVGLFVATGLDKKVQTWAVDHLPVISEIEHRLIPGATSPLGEAAAGGRSTAADTVDKTVASGPDAPELRGIADWINTDPLTLQQLRGKVVLVDFWTYSCINCIRTQPYLNAWYERYRDQGFEIIGVHAPEFAFEKDPANVRRAVAEAEIKYPVALDNDFETWNAYHNRYWPAKYLIDQHGKVVWTHFGEGDYDEAEQQIRALLSENGQKAAAVTDPLRASAHQSPETYLGTDRARGFVGEPLLRRGVTNYQPARVTDNNTWALTGQWDVDGESVTAAASGATLTYRFAGREMYLVLGGRVGGTVTVTVNGKQQHFGVDAPEGTVTIDGARLYKLVKFDELQGGAEVQLTFSEGVRANAFTFG